MRPRTWRSTTTSICTACRGSDLSRHEFPLRARLPRDGHHDRVKAVFAEYRGRQLAEVWLTTNHVVAETVTLLRRLGHQHAAEMGRRLYSESVGAIHWATPEEERAAFQYFEKHSDQDYSFTDCLSFVVMDKLGIGEALTVDSDFTHRFIARPGPIRR